MGWAIAVAPVFSIGGAMLICMTFAIGFWAPEFVGETKHNGPLAEKGTDRG